MTEAQTLERLVERLVEALAVMDTRVDLRDHVESLIDAAEAKQQVRYVELEKAVKIAESTNRENFVKHNGILDYMVKQEGDFPRKTEVNALNKRIDELSTRVYWLLGVAAAAGTVSGAVASKVL